jgi:hypothetical protein
MSELLPVESRSARGDDGKAPSVVAVFEHLRYVSFPRPLPHVADMDNPNLVLSDTIV